MLFARDHLHCILHLINSIGRQHQTRHRSRASRRNRQLRNRQRRLGIRFGGRPNPSFAISPSNGRLD